MDSFYALEPSVLDKIERQTDYILEKIGIDVQGDCESLEALRSLGASIEGERVRISGEAIREFIAGKIPKTFIWHGRSAESSLICGKDAPIFAPVYGPPKVSLCDGNIVTGGIENYKQLIALCDQSKSLGTTGFLICYVHDLAPEIRHIKMAEAHLELSDKPFMGTVFSKKALEEVIDIVGRPLPKTGECNLLHLINSSPPLVYQKNPLECLRAASVKGEGCMITSYMMMGATSPVTVLGTVTQGYAETLIGLALSQIYRPGSPVVFGLYAVPFSMRNMQPVFGDPISNQVQLIGMQIAKRLGIPCRGDGGVTSSKIDDAQAGYEGGAATFFALHGGADIILHSAGWLESGRCVDMKKLLRESKFLERFIPNI